VRIEPPESWEPLEEALAAMDGFDWLILTSPNGVAATVAHLERLGLDIRALKGPRIAAIGPATAEAAAAAGLRVALCPEEHAAEGLLESLRAEGLRGRRLLLLRAAQGRELLPRLAEEDGAQVTVVPVYQTLPVDCPDPEAMGMLERHEVDFVTFASSSAVRSFVSAVGQERARELLEQVCIGCIGPVTAATAEELGLTPTVVPEQYTIEALVAALAAHFAAAPGRSDQ